MCIFGGGGNKPSYVAPAPPPLPDPAPPPPPPVQPIVHEPPQSVQQMDTQVKAKQSKRAQQGSLSKGASQLRIPLNTGGSSGGLNL
jgi:hypothetical protein